MGRKEGTNKGMKMKRRMGGKNEATKQGRREQTRQQKTEGGLEG